MNNEEIRWGYPRRSLYDSNHDTWEFHKFQPWTTLLPNNETYDHVYAYFGPTGDVDEYDWTFAAQLAAHAQYRNLFNGFITNMFVYTSGVIMWKTQSPRPALRGFLYDWYLESTGALTGVRSALRSPTSIVLNAKTWQLHFINRQVLPVSTCSSQNTGANFTWIDLHGETIASGEALLSSDFVPAMSSHLLTTNSSNDKLQWPNRCTDVCFLRIQEIGCGPLSQPSWYWLTDPLLGDAGNYSSLGELRRNTIYWIDIEIERCIVHKDQIYLDVVLQLKKETPYVYFYPTIWLQRTSGSRILPLFDTDDTNVVILPGTSQRRHLYSPEPIGPGNKQFALVLSGWNTHGITRRVDCSIQSELQPQ